MDIQTQRVYQPVEKEDGIRVLVDRVWPRGMTKEQVDADLWLKDAAPTTSLRKWFNHDRAKWADLKNRYYKELDARSETLAKLFDKTTQGRLTLLYSARDLEYNQAVALRHYLLAQPIVTIHGKR